MGSWYTVPNYSLMSPLDETVAVSLTGVRHGLAHRMCFFAKIDSGTGENGLDMPAHRRVYFDTALF